MAGERWLQQASVGKEVTEGAAVVATRRLYVAGDFTRVRAQNMIEVSTGTRDNQRDAKLRAVAAGAKLTMPLGADEIVEWLLGSIQGGATPVTALGASTWTFKPGNAIDPQTYEYYDGYRSWQLRGAKLDELKLSGVVDGDTKAEATLFGRELATGVTLATVTDRVPNFIQGWELQLYVDAFGGTPGTTLVPGTIISWEVNIKNNLARKYYGDNTQATGDVKLGKLDVQLTATLEGAASALAEYNNWDNNTKRLVRLQLGNNGAAIGTSVLKPQITVDVPLAWGAVDLSPEDKGTKVYKFTGNYIYDPTNAYGIQVKLQNARATAY